MTEIALPESIQSVGLFAFNDCDNLTKAKFTSIESLCKIKFEGIVANPLYYAQNLYISGVEVTGELEIPTTVESIGDYAFVNCDGLTSVTFTESLHAIGSASFYGCSNLTRVKSLSTIPPTMNSFDDRIYDDAKLELPESSILDYLATNWGRFENIYPLDSETALISYSVEGLNYRMIPAVNSTEDNIAVIISTTHNLNGSITIPEYIDYTDNNGNTSSYYIEGISYEAFQYSAISEISFNSRIKFIGDFAFNYCTNLTKISLTESLQTIGSYAFKNCSGLTKAEFASIESMCSIQFKGYYANPLSYANHLYINGGEVTKIEIPSTVQSIGNFAFEGGSYLTEVTIGNSVETIGYGAFEGCSGLTEVSIGNSIQSIDTRAFYSCINLTKAEFASIESMCSIQFGGNSANPLSYANHLYINGGEVTKIEIPSTVQSIGNSAFEGGSYLTEITIGNSVESIGNNAFVGCHNLASIYYSADIPVEAEKNIFGNSTYESATLYVPETSIEEYQQTHPWMLFANIVAYDFSGIEDINSDTTGADIDYTLPYEVFNLSGIRVSATTEGLAPGLYIIRQGKTAKKIMAK